MDKRFSVGLGALLFLSAATLFVMRPRKPNPAKAPVVPEAVEKVEIVNADGHVLLSAQGKVWMITAPLTYPANGELVNSFLSGLRSLTLLDPVTTRPESYSIY